MHVDNNVRIYEEHTSNRQNSQNATFFTKNLIHPKFRKNETISKNRKFNAPERKCYILRLTSNYIKDECIWDTFD
jgi:hypothetical protein